MRRRPRFASRAVACRLSFPVSPDTGVPVMRANQAASRPPHKPVRLFSIALIDSPGEGTRSAFPLGRGISWSMRHREDRLARCVLDFVGPRLPHAVDDILGHGDVVKLFRHLAALVVGPSEELE